MYEGIPLYSTGIVWALSCPSNHPGNVDTTPDKTRSQPGVFANNYIAIILIIQKTMYGFKTKLWMVFDIMLWKYSPNLYTCNLAKWSCIQSNAYNKVTYAIQVSHMPETGNELTILTNGSLDIKNKSKLIMAFRALLKVCSAPPSSASLPLLQSLKTHLVRLSHLSKSTFQDQGWFIWCHSHSY